MGMLDRIKRRELDGFKEFVHNLETTGGMARQQIFIAGILEDPVFMQWVLRNTKGFEDLIKLPADELEAVLLHQEQIPKLFARALSGLPMEQVREVESGLPKFSSVIRDELSYLPPELAPAEREGAKVYLLKIVRKLQAEERILGFHWQLPPTQVFYPKQHPDGTARIFFDHGVLAAEGPIVKNQRQGIWKHFYDGGKLLAQGEYRNGLKIGEWVFYYTNGSIKGKGLYKDDLRNGRWKEWDRSGNEQEIVFKLGVRQEPEPPKHG
jgi:hypothetical protein